MLLDLTLRSTEGGRTRVTVNPDVSSSTNLGGWADKVGIGAPGERDDWFDDRESILHWRERPNEQPIELGIAEVSLFDALGATWSRWG